MSRFRNLAAAAHRYWSNNVLLEFPEPQRRTIVKSQNPVCEPRAAVSTWEDEGGRLATKKEDRTCSGQSLSS